MINHYSPERLADRFAINDVILRWCRAVDRLDVEALRDLYHEDGIDNHGAYQGGVEGLINWVRTRHKGIEVSSHQVSNVLIEFAGPDVALVETYIRVIQTYPPEARESLAQLIGSAGDASDSNADLVFFTTSRYVDKFERRNGVWRIQERNVIDDWSRVIPMASRPASQKPSPIEHGRRDFDDALFREQAKLGLRIS